MRYLVERSLDLWGIWMKVAFGMTHWVFINYLEPKNRRRPNLAAAQETKTYLSLFKNMRFFDLFSEKSPYAVGVKRK